MKEETIIRLRDFYQAVLLHASRLQLISIENNETKFATFVFEDPEFKAEDIIENHFAGALKIPTIDLIRSIHEVKNRLYASKERRV